MNKYSASLIGCAIGDALGMPVEGWKREQIRKYVGRITSFIDPVLVKDKEGKLLEEDEFGEIKYYTKDFRKGEYTDDTILTLTIAESLAEKGEINIEDIARKHLDTYNKDCKGFGSTTRDAMENLKKGISPLNSGVIGGPGNAPAMKMSPIGFYIDATKKYEEGLKSAEIIGQITHLDPRSVVSGVLQAHAVYALLNNYSREEFVNSLTELCGKWESSLEDKFTWHHQGTLLSRIEWIEKNQNADSESAYQKIGCTSVVYRSYPFALFMFQKYWDDPIKGLIELVNFGGDCDTTGAMYGSLVGAKHGDIFPEKWKNELHSINHLLNLGEKIEEKLKK